MQACIHDAHSTRSSHALRDHMEAFCGRVLAVRRIVTLPRTAFDVLVPRVPAEATRRLRLRSVLPTSHGRGGVASRLMARRATLPSPWSSDRPGTAVFGSAWSVLIPRSDMRAMRAMCAFVSSCSYKMPHFKERYSHGSRLASTEPAGQGRGDGG